MITNVHVAVLACLAIGCAHAPSAGTSTDATPATPPDPALAPADPKADPAPPTQAAAVPAVPAPAPLLPLAPAPPGAAEFIVVDGGLWDAYHSHWVWAKDGAVGEVAARAELFASDGTRAWAIRQTWGWARVPSCEDGPETREAVTVWAVQALGGVPPAPLTPLFEGEPVGVTIQGNVGPALWLVRSGFLGGSECVPHDFINQEFVVRDLATDTERAPSQILDAADSPVGAQALDALRRASMGGDAGDPTRSISLVAWRLQIAPKGMADVEYTFTTPVSYMESDHEWDTNSLAYRATARAAPELGLGEVPAVVRQAAAKGSTIQGWSSVPRDPAARARLLALFQQPVPELEPKPEASDAAPDPEPPLPTTPTVAPVSRDALLAQATTAMHAADYAKALALYNQAVQAAPTIARAWSGRGYARLKLHLWEAARGDFEKALSLETRDANFQAAVYFNLAQIAQARGDLTAARAHLERSLALRENKAVRAELVRLK